MTKRKEFNSKDYFDNSRFIEKKPLLKEKYVLLATWFGAGFMRPAAGTWGSLAALPFAWVIVSIGGPILLLLATILVTLLGLWSSHFYEKFSGEHDSSDIVIDEVAGMWLTLLFVPQSLLLYGIGFALFRIFDIYKPFPCSRIDAAKKGAISVMFDDLVAGLYAALGLTFIAKELGFDSLF
ncbi:MAG: phosphatidylglycerophosphatase A family protein [Alphaproteobacteria bacterium]